MEYQQIPEECNLPSVQTQPSCPSCTSWCRLHLSTCRMVQRKQQKYCHFIMMKKFLSPRVNRCQMRGVSRDLKGCFGRETCYSYHVLMVVGPVLMEPNQCSGLVCCPLNGRREKRPFLEDFLYLVIMRRGLEGETKGKENDM